FDNNSYIGRLIESENFSQNFNYNGSASSPNSFTPAHGCEFLTNNFTIRYKMKLKVSPGSYEFLVRGDDGFRLSLDSGATWVINDWKNGPAQSYKSHKVEINSENYFHLVLEYYEN